MLHRKGVARIAACAALACAGVAGAETTNSASNQDLVLRPLFLQDTAPATPPAVTPTPPKPLMGLLDSAGVGKPLEDLGITLGGYVDGGYTVTTNGDSAHVPIAGRVFDSKNNRFVFDQADFYFDRPVDYGKAATNHTFDVGAHLDLLYGWDSGLVHSNGLFDNPATLGVTKGYYRSRTSPENQFDVEQAFVDVALPVGSGLRLRAGKFVTLLGYETINPTTNPFYSHTYLFGFAIPFTHTGVMGEYKLSDDLLIDAGITRGWNQSINDNNGDPDFLGGITWTPQESDMLKKWKFILNLSEGPQGTHDNADWWTVLDLQAVYTATDKLTLVANVDYGDAPHAPGVTGAPQWYGIAGYGAFVLNDYMTANVRGEYYGDNKGFTLATGVLENLYEATLNVAIKPFPTNNVLQNLLIRPEVRYDYSDKNFFKGGTKHSQATFGIDAYFVF